MNTERSVGTSALFSKNNLAVFERHGATVTQCESGHPGCWVKLPNGWTLSVQWGAGMYGSNRDEAFGSHNVPDALEAEIAAWRSEGSLVRWRDGDTVQGWCTMERVQKILDLLADDTLMVADDGWQDDPS